MVRFIIGAVLLVLWGLSSLGQIAAVALGPLPPGATRADLVPGLLRNQIIYLVIIAAPAVLLIYFGRKAIKRKREARQSP